MLAVKVAGHDYSSMCTKHDIQVLLQNLLLGRIVGRHNTNTTECSVELYGGGLEVDSAAVEAAETGFGAGGCSGLGEGAALGLALWAESFFCQAFSSVPVAGFFWPLLFLDFLLAFGWWEGGGETARSGGNFSSSCGSGIPIPQTVNSRSGFWVTITGVLVLGVGDAVGQRV